MKSDSEPDKQLLFNKDLTAKQLTRRKIGRPKNQWNEEGLKDSFEKIKPHIPADQRLASLNPRNNEHTKIIETFLAEKTEEGVFQLTHPKPKKRCKEEKTLVFFLRERRGGGAVWLPPSYSYDHT